MAKSKAIDKSYTKTELLTEIAERTGLHKRDIANTLEELNDIIVRHLNKKGPGEFTLPGMLKFKLVTKPAVKARKGINPFTGEEVMFKAKPARNVIKIKALKKLKDAV